MQLRRAVPLSLLALLASAGCVSVGPEAPVPVRGPVPPVGVPGAPPTVPASSPLPLGQLPAPGPDPEADPERGVHSGADGSTPAPARSPGKAARPPAGRQAKPKVPPRRVRPPKPTAAHPHRHPALPARMDELCAAAGDAVPPSIVDLCLRQYGR
ncbi:hypothetical protein OG264_05025 [Streptomyces xanthophaeus]|uniref:hypothetical protein n=1 Tax=Streptomyces xanthophaeus TaxID=67385 RepID=UPI00386CE63D|nr:hypothetical protein OG264_05025 [Streptomyces xanthophaeus]WST64098.1 hypothetical protein OG605_33335 [Streptomyces xanthophaeus]